MFARYVRRILLAKVYDLAIESPLEHAPILSERWNNDVWVKREDLQPTFSFKVRGAYNKMAQLEREALRSGVIAASAGNHAQGVALSAQRLGCRAVIVMPATTPQVKVKAVEGYGADVVLHGDDYQDAATLAERLAQERGLTFIHPYDDPDVIAGQGTIAMELLRQHQGPLDAVFLAIGGGGLIAGVGAYLKMLRPGVRVIGVQPECSCAMKQSLDAGERVSLDRVDRFADGVAVRRVGVETFRIAQRVVDEVVLVSNDHICAAIKDVFEDRRCILEPAGALAIAGAKAWCEANRAEGQNLIAVACGANVNFDTLRHISERAEIGERREAVFVVTIPERPGSFRAFCSVVGPRAITEFNYRMAPNGSARIFVGIRTSRSDERAALLSLFRKSGYQAEDLTEDEVAKLHVRHMVGGRAHGLDNERIMQFQFPERVGALGEFLAQLPSNWNISLFHYRNHGSDFGRALAGVQVPPGSEEHYATHLDKLGYDWADVTHNPACSAFLR